MKKRLFFIICAVMCLFLVLCSCSCESEDTTETTNSHVHGTGDRPDNQNPSEPPKLDIDCKHYWHNVTFDTNTDSTGSAIIKGVCYLCGESLSKEVVTRINHEEWAVALSSESLNNFTVINGVNYTNYSENGSMSWRVVNDIHTEEYFVNNPERSSIEYAKNFLGYAGMHQLFTYEESSRAYVYEIDSEHSVKIAFADNKLFSLTTVSPENETTTMYVNYGTASTQIPDYFFERYNKIIDTESLKNASVSQSDAEKINAFLKGMSFESKYEVAYTENGGLSVYFYIENGENDPIFGGEYTFVSVVASDDKITSLTVGANSIEFSYAQ